MRLNQKETLLSVSNLTVHFATDRGVVSALDRAELSVGRGEVVGLIGESGCGKTTLARSVLRVLPPSMEQSSSPGKTW